MTTYRGYHISKSDTGGRAMGREVWYIVNGISNSHHTTLAGAKQAIDFVLDGDGLGDDHRDAIAAMLMKKRA